MCVYNKKASVYMCVSEVILINILVLQLGPFKQKFLVPPLLIYIYTSSVNYLFIIWHTIWYTKIKINLCYDSLSKNYIFVDISDIFFSFWLLFVWSYLTLMGQFY